MKVLVAALLLAPVVALASSPFDGTWKIRTESMKVTGKPDVFGVADGMYTCTSCVPQVKVKADGTDQKVSGNAYHDTTAVKVLSPTSIEIVNKLAGKPTGSTTYEVSADGKSLTGKFTDYTGEKPATGTFNETRVLAAAAGSHAVSGTWQPGALVGANEETRTYRYEMTPDSFGMHWNGQTYQAKFDGKEYPVANDPGHTVVTLKMVDPNTVMETDHRLGKVTDEIRLAAAKDGKTLEVTDKDVQHGQTVTYTLEKQP